MMPAKHNQLSHVPDNSLTGSAFAGDRGVGLFQHIKSAGRAGDVKPVESGPLILANQNKKMNITKLLIREQLATEWQRTTTRHKIQVAMASFGAGILLLGILLLTGCGTNQAPMTKAAFGAAVTLGEQFALEQHPEATVYVKAAAAVVCSAVSLSNSAPTDIVAALNAGGVTNAEAKLIVNGSLALYNVVFSYLGTNQPVLQDYAKTLCEAMNAGLPTMATARKSALISPHLK